MKRTWFSNEEQYLFAKAIDDADYSRNFSDLFYTWCELTAITFRQAVLRFTSNELDSELENSYLRAVEKLEKPDKFSEALGILVLALEKGGIGDFLGEVFGAVAIHNKYLGQFFTPYSISILCAKITLSECAYDPDRVLTISEPTCGSGGMVMAATQVLRDRKEGFPSRGFFVQAQDIDRRCFYMCYIQMTLADVCGCVILGDTLRLTETTRWYTLSYYMHGMNFRKIFDTPRKRKRRRLSNNAS